ncbi:hypothetical protein [Jannaschia sp. 2305UL9-9]|uniref:hypothetical protein n=1 Tax=Jannaschia sp. 2305UL9-9 TaxID=3121638 RepID=UPI00352879B4
MVVFLAVQALVFATWVVMTLSVLWAVFRRAQAGGPLPGPAAQIAALRSYLADPATRSRRQVWLGLTVLLLCLSFVFAMALTQI